MIAALKEGYASIGFERGRNVLVKLNKFLVNKRMLVKEGKGYKYNLISTTNNRFGLVRVYI